MAAMQIAAVQLPQDFLDRHAKVLWPQDRLAETECPREGHEQRIAPWFDDITPLERKRFGPSADRIPADRLDLFDEAELEVLITELEQ